MKDEREIGVTRFLAAQTAARNDLPDLLVITRLVRFGVMLTLVISHPLNEQPGEGLQTFARLYYSNDLFACSHVSKISNK